MAGASLALGFATFERPHMARRLIASIRAYFPDLPIYVADQSLQMEPMRQFYRTMNVHLIRMRYDSGVSASRNAIIEQAREDFIILCDDDFIFGSATRFDDALRMFERYPDIGVIGGKLFDFHETGCYPRHWELFLLLDPANRILTSVPIYHYAPSVRELGSVRCYMCDAVMNFSVLRRAMFSASVRWDEQFKSNGEHEDFYLNLKVSGAARVAYLPSMVAYHHHPQEYEIYRSRLRDRTDGWRLFMRKWQLDQHMEIGLGVRTSNDFAQTFDEMESKKRFFLNADLSLRRGWASRDVLEIHDFEHLAPIASLDQRGDPYETPVGEARLLIHRVDGRVQAVADPAGEPAEIFGPLSTGSLPPISYTLEAMPQTLPAPIAIGPIVFRYNPVARRDADFILWYLIEPGGADMAQDFPVHLRWRGMDGQILVWLSEPRSVSPAADGIWRPILLNVPVHPKSAAMLSFEVIAQTERGEELLAVGFLCQPIQAAGPRAGRADPISLDVMALDPRRRPANNIRDQPIDFAAFPAGRPTVQINCPKHPAFPPLLILPLHRSGDLDHLFLLRWHGVGSSFICIRPPSTSADAPPHIALPRPALLSASRVFGHSRTLGYVRIQIDETPIVTAANGETATQAADGRKMQPPLPVAWPA